MGCLLGEGGCWDFLCTCVCQSPFVCFVFCLFVLFFGGGFFLGGEGGFFLFFFGGGWICAHECAYVSVCLSTCLLSLPVGISFLPVAIASCVCVSISVSHYLSESNVRVR